MTNVATQVLMGPFREWSMTNVDSWSMTNVDAWSMTNVNVDLGTLIHGQ